MIGFEVIVNGTKVCVAALGAPGDLRVHAIWVLRHSQEDLTGTPGTADERLGLQVAGKAYGVGESLEWLYTQLKVGGGHVGGGAVGAWRAVPRLRQS
jgi:hypothetical protein